MVGEIRMEKPVQALDTTFGGRIAAMAGAGTQVILAKMDWMTSDPWNPSLSIPLSILLKTWTRDLTRRVAINMLPEVHSSQLH